MRPAEAQALLESELDRALMLTHRTLEECQTRPTDEELIETGFTPEEAAEFQAEWSPEEEQRDWERRRDRCTALTCAIAALDVVIALEKQTGTPFPEIKFSSVSPESNVRRLFKRAGID